MNLEENDLRFVEFFIKIVKFFKNFIPRKKLCFFRILYYDEFFIFDVFFRKLNQLLGQRFRWVKFY